MECRWYAVIVKRVCHIPAIQAIILQTTKSVGFMTGSFEIKTRFLLLAKGRTNCDFFNLPQNYFLEFSKKVLHSYNSKRAFASQSVCVRVFKKPVLY